MATAPGKSKAFYVVEDSPFVLESWRWHFGDKLAGAFPDPQSFLTFARTNPAAIANSVVITDFEFEGDAVDGDAFCHQLKAEFPGVIVLLCSDHIFPAGDKAWFDGRIEKMPQAFDPTKYAP